MKDNINPKDYLKISVNKNPDIDLSINVKSLQIASILNTLDLKGMNRQDEMPMLSIPFLDWINCYDFSEYNIVEFGSGNSTNYFADRFKSVISFETNKQWFNVLSPTIKENVDYRLISKKDALNGKYEIPANDKTVVLIDIDVNRTVFTKNFFEKYKLPIVFIDNSDWFPDTAQYIQDCGYIEIPFWGIRFEDFYDKNTSVFIKHGFLFPKTKYQHSTKGAIITNLDKV